MQAKYQDRQPCEGCGRVGGINDNMQDRVKEIQDMLKIVQNDLINAQMNLEHVNNLLDEKHNRMRLFQTVLLGYEQWEADIILENECWGVDGMNNTPRLTINLHERMLKLQEMRNSALYPKGIPSRQIDKKMDWGKANCAVMGAIGTIEDNDDYKQESIDGLYDVFYYIDGLNRSRNYYKDREKVLQNKIDADYKRLMEACEKVDMGFMGCDTPDWLADRILELEGREKVLRDALEFYADDSNWQSHFDCISEAGNDEGVIAREALGQEVKI